MSSAVVTEDLTKCFEDVTAVDRLNLRVEIGEIFGFLGPNGSGKTTTVRILCGIMDLTSGTALTAGYDVVEEPDRPRPLQLTLSGPAHGRAGRVGRPGERTRVRRGA